MRFFFIKSRFKNVEQVYWLNGPQVTLPLTKEKVVDEFLALGFYRLMGISTPKTYLGSSANDAVLISKMIKNWQGLRFNDNSPETPSLPSDLDGVAELELAAAILSDIDLSGWVFDNIGKKKTGDKVRLTKHDGGTQVLSSEKLKFYLHFFQLKQQDKEFPQGISTLCDDDSLNHTYLKVFLVDNVTRYNQRYKHLFDNLTPEHRKRALIKLFHIERNDLMLLVSKIPDDWLPPAKKVETVNFLESRLAEFRKKYQPQLGPINATKKEQSSNYFFQKLLNQKRVVRDDWASRFVVDTTFSDNNDWSQSGAGQQRYIKN